MGAEERDVLGFEAGARLVQNREWFICPVQIIRYKAGSIVDKSKPTTPIEFQGSLQCNLFLDTFGCSVALLGSVETVNVGLVVFGMVQPHYLL